MTHADFRARLTAISQLRSWTFWWLPETPSFEDREATAVAHLISDLADDDPHRWHDELSRLRAALELLDSGTSRTFSAGNLIALNPDTQR